MRNLVVALALGLTNCAFAQSQDSPWRFYAGGGFASGGDLMAKGSITITGTTHVIPFEVRPGSGIPLRIGAEYRLDNGLALRANVGRAVTDPAGINGSLTLTTSSGELLGFYQLAQGLRLGAGLRQSFADLLGTGLSSGQSHFRVSPGTVLEAQYVFTRQGQTGSAGHAEFGLALRKVTETLTDETQTSFKGDHYEVGFVIHF